MHSKRILGVLSLVLVLGGCAMEAPDGIDDVGVVPGGKADGSDYSTCELAAVPEWLNEGQDADTLREAGIHSRAANNLVSHRDGADGAFGTADDDLFDDIAEVDGVSWVGPVAIRQLVASIADRCVTVEPPSGDVEVIMSPNDYDDSHVARIRELIDGADSSIDIAMYSFRDSSISAALERAVDRGVSIRFLFEKANSDRSDMNGGASGAIEDMGIEVRYINKINHHKFAIIDGARTSLDAADTGILVSGSGNWSNGAATRFDENTVILHGNRELNLRYQREFNHLWDNSRPFTWNETIAPVEAIAIEESDIADDPSVDALFTSANFTVRDSSRYGRTFSVERGLNTVADRWVELISNAQSSIRIASGHLRSRPIAEAIVAAQAANPDLDVRVYLDGQEYISTWVHDEQLSDLDVCLEEAGDSEARQQDCTDRGFLFSYTLHQAGVPVRFKYYSYRWNYSYADQMHHKYMIIDENIVVTGSYNLSDNAEHNTMENIMIFEGDSHRATIDAFIDNFDALWVTGEADGLYGDLMDEIENGGDTSFPIVFTPMAIDWDQVTALKGAIRDNCPEINSTEFRSNPAAHRYCDR
ncbi:MAG: phospholipase D-like domain-containing protein [Sandaracinaceae bacterium]